MFGVMKRVVLATLLCLAVASGAPARSGDIVLVTEFNSTYNLTIVNPHGIRRATFPLTDALSGASFYPYNVFQTAASPGSQYVFTTGHSGTSNNFSTSKVVVSHISIQQPKVVSITTGSAGNCSLADTGAVAVGAPVRLTLDLEGKNVSREVYPVHLAENCAIGAGCNILNNTYNSVRVATYYYDPISRTLNPVNSAKHGFGPEGGTVGSKAACTSASGAFAGSVETLKVIDGVVYAVASSDSKTWGLYKLNFSKPGKQLVTKFTSAYVGSCVSATSTNFDISSANSFFGHCANSSSLTPDLGPTLRKAFAHDNLLKGPATFPAGYNQWGLTLRSPRDTSTKYEYATVLHYIADSQLPTKTGIVRFKKSTFGPHAKPDLLFGSTQTVFDVAAII